MKKITVPILNMLLAAGFICILVGFFLLIHPFAGVGNVAPFVNVCLIFFGAFCCYFSLVKYRHASLFFFGLYLCLGAGLFLFVTSGLCPYSFAQLWPFDVMLCGVCLFCTCLFRHRKILTAYLFPALLLVVLGGFFLLFSLDIITMSFRSFVSQWWPVMLILAGVFLVGLFLYQQHPAVPFPYENDEEPLDGEADGE